MKLTIVTPVYHEQENICKVIDGLREHVKTPYEFLIVYDTNEDPTYETVKKYTTKHKIDNVFLVKSHVGNGRGFANALKSGFLMAKGDAVLVMMADLCDNPADIDAMYAQFKKGSDLVCASRYVKGGAQIGSPLVKRTLSRWAGVSLYHLGCMPIHDVTNNFKMYRRTMLNKLPLPDEGGFELAMAITIMAHRAGYTLSELPTTWRDREAGEAKFNVRKMLPRYFKWYLRAIISGNRQ
jgi:glycosyltransferase involved in cell wall biosynthesis